MEQNRLAQEKSPYLLQHKDNPIHWYPWGDEAFQTARLQQKPVFLSIGYSTCYWCHMMEEDSFETEEVASLLNESFISIKVDREERPDVDAIYMDAVVALTGQGGWPLTVFLTPDRKPFWGGTFFWKAQFKSILQQITSHWSKEQATIHSSAEKIAEHLHDQSLPQDAEYDPGKVADVAFETYEKAYDARYGGFGRAPKFPPAMALSFLLRYAARTNSDEAFRMTTHTLTAMACGGLFDQLEGGFSRYSTDEKWLAPHFEKMLYDNALLVRVYAEAYARDENPLFRGVVEETLAYLSRRMTSVNGAFFTAEDAGEAGKEGEFYVWPYEELRRLLSEDELEEASRHLGVTVAGNFEEANILTFQDAGKWSERYSGSLLTVLTKLRNARDMRRRPHLDDKVLTGWNGLMIAGLAHAYRVLGTPAYLDQAVACARFLLRTVLVDETLHRRYRDGDVRFAATLEDYAFFIDSLIALHQATQDVFWLENALLLQKQQQEHLWQNEKGCYITSAADDLFVRKTEFFDSAIPSGNAVSLRNLISLAALTGEKEWYETRDRLLQAYAGPFLNYRTGVPEALRELERLQYGPQQLIIVASDRAETFQEEVRELQKQYGDAVLVLTKVLAEPDSLNLPVLRDKQLLNDRTTLYRCQEGRCQQPEHDMQAVHAGLQSP